MTTTTQTVVSPQTTTANISHPPLFKPERERPAGKIITLTMPEARLRQIAMEAIKEVGNFQFANSVRERTVFAIVHPQTLPSECEKPTIVLSHKADQMEFGMALGCGAYDYVACDMAGSIVKRLSLSVKDLLAGENNMRRFLVIGGIEKNACDLPKHEVDLIQQVVRGMPYKEIAARNDFHLQTVKNRISKLCKRLRVDNQAGLIGLAYRSGWAK